MKHRIIKRVFLSLLIAVATFAALWLFATFVEILNERVSGVTGFALGCSIPAFCAIIYVIHEASTYDDDDDAYYDKFIRQEKLFAKPAADYIYSTFEELAKRLREMQ